MTTGVRLPRCLVLLASYNGAQYIGEQLDSILAQRGTDVSVLIGDDASTDATLHIVEQMQAADRIRVLRRNVGSGSAAQNFSQLLRDADFSGYDYVALSDQDDIWLPDKLRRAIDSLAASSAGGYSCSVLARWEDGTESVFSQSPCLREADFLFEGAGQGCTFVMTASLFETVQAVFRQRPDLTSLLIYHDWAIYALARVQHIAWVFDAEPLMVYRQHAENDTGARHSIDGVRRRLRLLANGRYARQVAAVCELCLHLVPDERRSSEWKRLQTSTAILQRIGKALFCLRYGRRRSADRLLTSIAAIVGWL
ncbi:MAG: glycosyltransferase [Pseudomonadota bacterium]